MKWNHTRKSLWEGQLWFSLSSIYNHLVLLIFHWLYYSCAFNFYLTIFSNFPRLNLFFFSLYNSWDVWFKFNRLEGYFPFFFSFFLKGRLRWKCFLFSSSIWKQEKYGVGWIKKKVFVECGILISKRVTFGILFLQSCFSHPSEGKTKQMKCDHQSIRFFSIWGFTSPGLLTFLIVIGSVFLFL
jgi:hypothetical protein